MCKMSPNTLILEEMVPVEAVNVEVERRIREEVEKQTPLGMLWAGKPIDFTIAEIRSGMWSERYVVPLFAKTFSFLGNYEEGALLTVPVDVYSGSNLHVIRRAELKLLVIGRVDDKCIALAYGRPTLEEGEKSWTVPKGVLE